MMKHSQMRVPGLGKVPQGLGVVVVVREPCGHFVSQVVKRLGRLPLVLGQVVVFEAIELLLDLWMHGLFLQEALGV
jgi:hypothetical protein